MDHKREHRTPPPPLARVMGVGRQQQHVKSLGTAIAKLNQTNNEILSRLNKLEENDKSEH